MSNTQPDRRSEAPAEPEPDHRFALPESSLPEGGGAIRGLDERLAVNGANGTASFSLPLPISAARGGQPTLTLGYTSGGGNGSFGQGWAVDIPSISRRTDRGLPRYRDSEESDVYVMTGVEDLVLARDPSGAPIEIIRADENGQAHRVRRYRPRIEGAFSRIERWENLANGIAHWRVTTAGNVTSVFGQSDNARLADPEENRHVFRWMCQRRYDDRGNLTLYEYKPEDLAGVTATPADGPHLSGVAPVTALYPKRLLYGNRAPFTPGDPIPADTGFRFQTVFDYGEHGDGPFADLGGGQLGYPANPQPLDAGIWGLRPDAFSSFRSGFEIRTWRRCRRVLLFHAFDVPELVRSVDLSYDESSGISHLVTATSRGYIRDGAGYTARQMPAITFTYAPHAWNTDVRAAAADELSGLRAGNSDPDRLFTDLFGEGLPGMLTRYQGNWYYARNRGEGRFGPQESIDPCPALATAAGGLTDIAGDGRQRLTTSSAPRGHYTLEQDETWSAFQPFALSPNADPTDPNARPVDLTGDGRPDLLITEAQRLVWYPSTGSRGHAPPEVVSLLDDETLGPRVVFADPGQSVYLADMTGDGLTDIVRIRNGAIAYWPNRGYGRFGARIEMADAPAFDAPDRFDPSRIRLADIAGSGPADLIYISDRARIWQNLSGNSWRAAPIEIAGLPSQDAQATLETADVFGQGTACLVWTSSLPVYTRHPLRVVDLMAGAKPHLMTGYSNGSGAAVSVEYASSTRFYLADRAAGRPWATRLPFPVHVVSRRVTRDLVAGTSRTERFSYHHGHYDTVEREFRGFARVDRRDSESAEHFVPDGADAGADPLDQAPVLTRTWYHTGAGPDVRHLPAALQSEFFADQAHPEPALPPMALPQTSDAEEARGAARSLKGKTLREEVYAEDGSPRAGIPLTIATSRYRVSLVQPAGDHASAIFLPTVLETLTSHVEQGVAAPRIAHTLTLEIDELGNPLRSANVVYPRAIPQPTIPAEAQAAQAVRLVTTQLTTYSNDIDTDDNYRLRLAVEEQSFELTGLTAPAGDIYLLEELDTAIGAASDIAHEATPSGAPESRITSALRTEFLDDDGIAPLPFGAISASALARRSLALAFTPGLITEVYGSAIDAGAMHGAGYVGIDGNWWRPTSIVSYGVFFQSVTVTTPFGDSASIAYDADGLMVASRTDFVGNVTQFINDSRTLSPREKISPNLNRTQIATDELGFVTATARLGKGAEGDTLADPTVRHSYDLSVFATTGHPNFVRTERRERHDPGAPLRSTVEYTNGAGGVQLVKRQAEPGLARVRTPGGVTEIDTTPALRWIASGRIVQNNKGNPVKVYEPYFAVDEAYESEADLVEVGVSSIRHYDPLGRVIRIDHPDGTFERVDFTPWMVIRHDQNDTVLDSDWYAARGAPDPSFDPEPADPETRAAWLAAQHADTPTREHFDTLGRSVITETDPGSGPTQLLRTVLDIQNRQREVINARRNSAMRYRYEITGERIAEDGLDSGARRLFPDAQGRSILGWDSRNHRTRTEYDPLDRPVRGWLSVGAAAEVLTTFSEFGDGPAAPADAVARNLRTRLFRRFDQAGLVENDRFDFNGNLTRLRRRLLSATTGINDYATPAPETLLDAETFVSETRYDAMSRPIEIRTPASGGMIASTITPAYNQAQALERIDLSVRGGASQAQITNIDYDAHGRRRAIDYANGSRSEHSYDPVSFRLMRVLTLRAGTPLQDLRYTYDPVGNVTGIRDAAQADVYFNNTVVNADSRFRYNALYRLTFASGREHIGQNQPTSPEDPTRRGHLHPGDGGAMRRYEQAYDYDVTGNLLEVVHRAGNGAFAEQWRRTATFAATSNRLVDTTAAGVTVNYSHDAHGNLAMPHLDVTEWDQNDRLRRVVRGTAEGRYCYDADGTRVRKTEIRGGVTEERLYLGGFELFRRRTGATLELERETIHLLDGESRIALVETNTTDTDTPANVGVTLARFQYHTHIGSAALELDGSGVIISYEEYYPFGATAYQAGRSMTETRRKTYRYVAAEQDDITGLYHMGARYYAPWIGRWTQTDPKGLVDGPNLYRYARNNPVRMTDRQGTDPDDEVEVGPLRLTNIRIDATGGPGVTPTGIPMFLPPRPGPRLQFTSQLSLAPMPPSLPLDTPAPEELPQQRQEETESEGDSDSGTPVRAEASAAITSDPQTGNITASTLAFGTIGTIGSGIWGSLYVTGNFTAPPPDSPSIDPYLFARHAQGQGRFFGAVQVPNLTLATLSGDITLRTGGYFGFNAELGTIGDLARLNLEGSGQLREGGVDLEATGQLRLWGYTQLRLNVAGSVESSGEFGFAGGARGFIFPTPLPIPTTYAVGSFAYTSGAGFTGTGHLVGLGPFIPLAEAGDPSPLPPGTAVHLDIPSDSSIQPVVLGYGLFHYGQGRFSGFTVGGVLLKHPGQQLTPVGTPAVGASATLAF